MCVWVGELYITDLQWPCWLVIGEFTHTEWCCLLLPLHVQPLKRRNFALTHHLKPCRTTWLEKWIHLTGWLSGVRLLFCVRGWRKDRQRTSNDVEDLSSSRCVSFVFVNIKRNEWKLFSPLWFDGIWQLTGISTKYYIFLHDMLFQI